MVQPMKPTCIIRLSLRPAFHRLALASLALILLGGCNIVGYTADAIAGGQKKKATVEADYRGLDGRRIAVVVSADDHTYFEYPGAPLAVSSAVTERLAAAIPGAKLVDPKQIDRFQRENPYWNTLSYRELSSRLGVERLVYIDLTDYTTHEPGNKHVWRGIISANVGAAEAESADGTALVYSTVVRASYPEGNPVGVLDADDRSIELGMNQVFAAMVANLFRDHEVIKP